MDSVDVSMPLVSHRSIFQAAHARLPLASIELSWNFTSIGSARFDTLREE